MPPLESEHVEDAFGEDLRTDEPAACRGRAARPDGLRIEERVVIDQVAVVRVPHLVAQDRRGVGIFGGSQPRAKRRVLAIGRLRFVAGRHLAELDHLADPSEQLGARS